MSALRRNWPGIVVALSCVVTAGLIVWAGYMGVRY